MYGGFDSGRARCSTPDSWRLGVGRIIRHPLYALCALLSKPARAQGACEKDRQTRGAKAQWCVWSAAWTEQGGSGWLPLLCWSMEACLQGPCRAASGLHTTSAAFRRRRPPLATPPACRRRRAARRLSSRWPSTPPCASASWWPSRGGAPRPGPATSMRPRASSPKGRWAARRSFGAAWALMCLDPDGFLSYS